MCVLLLVLAALLPPVQPNQDPAAASDDVISIDGDRHPDLIPQWAVWEHAFRLFGRGAKLLPAPLLRHLVAAESSRLFAAAEAQLERETELQEYAVRLRLLVAREPLQVREARLRHARLDYRRGILDARDRLLTELSPAAQRALIDFVESKKATIRISLRKSELEWFFLPE